MIWGWEVMFWVEILPSQPQNSSGVWSSTPECSGVLEFTARPWTCWCAPRSKSSLFSYSTQWPVFFTVSLKGIDICELIKIEQMTVIDQSKINTNINNMKCKQFDVFGTKIIEVGVDSRMKEGRQLRMSSVFIPWNGWQNQMLSSQVIYKFSLWWNHRKTGKSF